MDRRSRSSSTGKSSLVEISISSINEYFKTDNQLEDLQTLAINNTLPNELRSIAWRIFLGILPATKEPFEWVTATNANRKSYENVINSEAYSKVKMFTSSSKDVTAINNSSGELKEIYNNLNKRLEGLREHYEFFKSQIVGETVIKIYFAWFVNNGSNNEELIVKSFDILAALVFSLFPSMIPNLDSTPQINDKDSATARNLYYFLNAEDFFDSDVYTIFDNLMNKKGVKNLILKSETRTEWRDTMQSVLEKDLKELDDEIEKIAYVYLKESNESLFKHLFESKIDPYITVKGLKTSLLTSSIKFDQIVYLWDVILAYSEKDTINFINYLSVALVNNTSTELKTEGESSDKHLVIEFSAKDIVKKAMKLKEKLDD